MADRRGRSVNEGGERNERERRRPVWGTKHGVRLSGLSGGLCPWGGAVSNRGGAGGAPRDTARSTSVSEPLASETPGNGLGCIRGGGVHGPLTGDSGEPCLIFVALAC